MYVKDPSPSPRELEGRSPHQCNYVQPSSWEPKGRICVSLWDYLHSGTSPLQPPPPEFHTDTLLPHRHPAPTQTPCSHTDTLLPHRHPAPTQTPCSHTHTLLPHTHPALTQTPCSHTDTLLPHRHPAPTQTPCSHTDTLLPHRHPAPTQTACSHTDTLLPHRHPAPTQTPCSHTDTLLPHRHPAPTQTPCSHTDTLLSHRHPAPTQTPCSHTANHVWASDTYWYMKQSSWLVDLCDWFTLLKTSRVLGANDLLSEMRQFGCRCVSTRDIYKTAYSLVWCFQIAKTNDFKFLDKNLNVRPDPKCNESSCTRCRPGTMSGEPWKTKRLYTHQRTGVCTRTEPSNTRHLHAPNEPLSFSGDVTTWQQSYNTSWHGNCHGYLLIALSISMVTSTDRAIVMGLLLEKMLQSILGNIRGSAGHCMWCVCINHVTTHGRTRRCLMMWEINERKDGKVRISI